jgi:hypothetical protein
MRRDNRERLPDFWESLPAFGERLPIVVPLDRDLAKDQ